MRISDWSSDVCSSDLLQLHLFADQSESVDLFLFERGFTFDVSERRYRYPDGREENVPLLRLMLDGLGVDLAVFGLDDLRRTPISPQNGRSYQRLTQPAAHALAAACVPAAVAVEVAYHPLILLNSV